MDFLRLNLLLSCERNFTARKLIGPNINETETKICFYVRQYPSCSQDDVAKALRLDKTTVAKALLSLENKNIIDRKIDKQDRRKKMLTITPEGVDLSKRLLEAHEKWMDIVCQSLSAEERAVFDSCCSKILTASEAWIAHEHELED